LKKGVEKGKKGVESKGGEVLPKIQRETLDMLTKDFKNITQIAKFRRCSKQSIYKIIRKLRQKGYLTRAFTRGLKKFTGLTPEGVEKIRLHGQQFKIKILWRSPLYEKIKQNKNIFIMDGHTITLNKQSLLVACNPLHHFWGLTPDEAYDKSMLYWLDFFIRLQDRLNIVILKGMNTSILQYNAHYGEVGNELAKDCNEEQEKIMIKGGEDGLVWVKADKSWNMDEIETIHPKEARADMQEVVQPFFNDLRDHKPPKLTDIMKIIREIAEYHKETAAGLNSITAYMESQLPKKKEIDPAQENLKDSYFG